MTLYRDEGIVLRTQKLGEADRIVTVLTRRGGRIRAAAKGVRKTKSRFGARLEPFTHVDLQLYERRSLDLITQAETLRPFGRHLVTDYPRYTSGTAMLETAEKLTSEEGEPALRQFLLLVGGLRTLAERGHDPRLVLDAYLLRSLSVAGWAPALDECCRCGTRGGLRGFAIASGGAVCARCRQPGAATPAPPTFALMLALLRGDWEYADESDARHRTECSGLVAAYLQWHLEHGIRSLRHVEREGDRPRVAAPEPAPQDYRDDPDYLGGPDYPSDSDYPSGPGYPSDSGYPGDPGHPGGSAYSNEPGRPGDSDDTTDRERV